jgi:hypothetical protein
MKAFSKKIKDQVLKGKGIGSLQGKFSFRCRVVASATFGVTVRLFSSGNLSRNGMATSQGKGLFQIMLFFGQLAFCER